MSLRKCAAHVATIKTKITAKSLSIEICSACHPFFTGTQKLVDTTGRVERFNKRYAKTAK